jgi:hypothetical protein
MINISGCWFEWFDDKMRLYDWQVVKTMIWWFEWFGT